MELELGLKITRTREDVSSSVDFRFSKDPFGPLVLSRETDSRFIIIIHLKGFKKEGIEIEINKEGNRITIRGRKPVEEMVLIRWMAWRKEVELRTFKKVFQIPDIVDLDKIKARFDDDDSTLTVTMPKRVKGISGFKLEEEEEEEEDVIETQNREEVEEEFEEMMEDKERESRVFEGEEKGFSGGLDEEETQIEGDDLERIQDIDEQDKILELSEEETVAQEELSDMNAETDDISLRKLLDIIEQEDQEVMEKEIETKNEGTESRSVEEIEEPEELDRTSTSKEMEKKRTDGDDDGLRKAQGSEEPERHNEESKVQEMVEEESGGQEEVAGSDTEIEDSILRKPPDIPEQEDKQEVMEKQVDIKSEGTESRAVEENEEPDELDRTSKSKAVEKKTTDGDDDDSLRKAQGIEEPEKQNEESKVQEMVEEETGGQEEVAETETKAEEFESEKETVGQQEFAGADTEIEDSILRKLPDILEQENNQEVMEQKVSQVETKSDDIGSRAIDDEQEPYERLDRTSDGGATEKKTTEDEGDGLRKVKGIEEPEGHNEGSNSQDIVEGFTPNIERRRLVGEDDIAETETKAEEFESGKPEADEVDKKHELVGKKEEEEKNANVRRKSEDRSLAKLQEDKEQHSKGRKRQDKQENIKDLVEEKTPDTETNIANDVPKPVQEIKVLEVGTSEETGDEGKQEKDKKKSVRNRDAKEEVDGKIGVPNIAETETKPAEFESEKLVADEVDKIHELVEKKKEEEEETNAKVRTQSEDVSLTKPQETQEQQSQGQNRHDKHEKIKELVEQTPEAETNIGNETPKPVQERYEGKQKIKEIFQEETKKQPEEHKEKMVETGEKINDFLENEQESYRPKILEEEEKVQEPAEEKMIFSKNRKLKEEEKIPEKKTEFGDDDVSRKVGDNQQQDSDAREEVDAETETKAEKFEPHKLEPDEGDEIHEMVEKKEGEEDNAKVGRQSEDRSVIKLQENEKQHSKGQKRQNKTAETETNIPKPVEETQVPEADTLGKTANEGEQGKEKQSVTMEITNRHPKEEVDAKNGKGFAASIAESTELKPKEFESDKLESDQVDEMHELVEKKEEGEDTAKVRRQNEESNLVKSLQETEEQQFQGQKRHNKQDKVKELLEEKTTAAERNILKPVQVMEETESYGPKTLVELEKIQELAEEKTDFLKNGKVKEDEDIAEKKTGLGDDDRHISRKVGDNDQRDSDAKEEFDAEMGAGFTQNTAETKKKAGEVDKIHDMVDKKKEEEEENDKVSKQSEDTSLKRLQEQGPNQHNKQENIKDLVEEKQEANTNIADEDLKSVQKTAKPEVETLETCEDKESAETETKEKESYIPKILGGEDKIQELSEEKINFSRKFKEEEKVAEKKTGDDDDDSSRKVRDIEQQGSDAMNGEEEKDKIQELKENRTTYQNDQEEEKEDEADGLEKAFGTRKPVEDKNKEEESETKTDDVVRKVQGTKEYELFEPKRDHVSKIKEVVEEKVAESEIEAECGGLSKAHGSEEQKLHKPNIQQESCTTKTNGTEKQSGQEKEEEKKQKIVVSMTITEKEKSTNVHDIKEEMPDKPGRHEEDSSKNFQEIEKQESDGPKRSTVQENNQETEDKEITRAMKEKEIVERKKKTEDGSLRKVQDDANLELSKPYKRQEDDKVQEPVETGTSDYREKVKKQDVNDILRSQAPGKPNLDEFERQGEQRNVPQLVDEEKMENIPKPKGRFDDDSGKFHEFEERKSYEDWTHDEREKIKHLVKEEATDPKDKQIGEAGHNDHKEEQQEERVISKVGLKPEEDISEKVQEMERQEFDELQRSLVQDKTQDITRAIEENEIVERRGKNKDGSLRKVREGEEDPELGGHKTYEEVDTSELERHRKQRKIHQPVKDEKGDGTTENNSEPGGKMEGDSLGKFQKQKPYEDWSQEESEEIEDLIKEEATDGKDKHTERKGEHEEERYEEVPQAKTKVEDEVNKKAGENKKEEEDLVDDFTTKIQETEQEEIHEPKIHEKLDMIQDFVEDETGDQEDERAGEAVVANNEKDSSRKLHSIEGEELKEPEKHKEQDEISKTNDPKVKEADGERVSEKETKEQEAQVQELEGKTENLKHDDGEVKRKEIDKQGKTVETKSVDGIVRKIEDLERRETSNHEVELVTEDDSLRKGQKFLENESSNVSKRRSVEQEEIQQLKEVGKREDEEKSVAETKTNAGKSRKLEMQELDESEENEELKKIRKPIEEKTNASEKEKGKEGNEKIPEVKMQDKIDIRMKDQDTKRKEPYKLLKNEEHGKIPEPDVEGTKYQREEQKRMADREIEDIKRKSEDVSSRKVQKIKAQESDGLEKHMELNEIQENQSVEHREEEEEEEEVNEGGGYKVVLKTKSMEDSSQSQDVEEKGSDHTERYAEQEKIQELMVEEEGKEEYDIREGEQTEKAKKILQVESKSNDDNSKKNVTERLSGQKQNEDHQELVEMEKNDQRKEVSEDEIVGKGETTDHEYKIQEHEEVNSDKLEKHSKEERSGSLAEEETSNDKELAVVVRQREQDKRESFVDKDTTSKAKENKNHETSRDDSSRKTQENENQESFEQKRNNEEQDKKNLGPNYCRNEEDGKEDKEISEAEGPRESNKMVEGHENQDNINELVEEKMSNQEGEDKKSMSMEVLAKSEDHEWKSPERLRKQDKSREVSQQRLRDNLEDEETEKTEMKTNDKESRKIHQIKSKETGEEERRKGQASIKELVEDRTQKQNRKDEYEDGSLKIPEIDKEELTEPGIDEKPDEIEEPVDRETSEDDEEELEVEVEDSEEDWEAEVIQEMDSDEDNDKFRQIRRIKLGFRLVGGSTLFMSLIVIVISIIRSKRKIRCYKF